MRKKPREKLKYIYIYIYIFLKFSFFSPVGSVIHRQKKYECQTGNYGKNIVTDDA